MVRPDAALLIEWWWMATGRLAWIARQTGASTSSKVTVCTTNSGHTRP